MEKKFKFSDSKTATKAIYGAVIAILCITAIVVGIVAANNRNNDDGKLPGIEDGDSNNNNNNNNNNNDNDGDNNNNKPQNPDDDKDEKTTFNSPVSGEVYREHSPEIPVYSPTLEEWRVHSGMDIYTEEDADVFAAASGEVVSVYTDPLMGRTVIISHDDNIKTVYSNLSDKDVVSVGQFVNQGEKIGNVGDSAIVEIADESHLHFEMLVNDKTVNPLNYISEESKKTSLGIDSEDAA